MPRGPGFWLGSWTARPLQVSHNSERTCYLHHGPSTARHGIASRHIATLLAPPWFSSPFLTARKVLLGLIVVIII